MTRGQAIQRAIEIIEAIKVTSKISKNSNMLRELNEIVDHLKFVGQFYL